MNSHLPQRDFSDDPFTATRMSLGDHIEELRRHLWRALSASPQPWASACWSASRWSGSLPPPSNGNCGSSTRTASQRSFENCPPTGACRKPMGRGSSRRRFCATRSSRRPEPPTRAGPDRPDGPRQLHYLAANEAWQLGLWTDLERHADGLALLADSLPANLAADAAGLRAAAQAQDSDAAEKILQRIGTAWVPGTWFRCGCALSGPCNGKPPSATPPCTSAGGQPWPP